MPHTLSKRLQAIQNMVPHSFVADIGADHGKLVISLVKSNQVLNAVAVENKIGPFNRLKKAIEDENLQDQIMALYSDGIKDIPNDVETVIIAGMGGFSILKILNQSKDKLQNIQTIIVDGHNAIPSLREGIIKLGYHIDGESMIYEDNVYYEIIKFVKGQKEYSDSDIEFGPILRKKKDSLFTNKWNKRIGTIDSLLSKETLSEERVAELKKERERILSVL